MDGFDRETGEVVARMAPRMPQEIAEAIIQVSKKVRQLGSDERNQHGGYAYVSVDKFYAEIGPMMAEAGIALMVDETSTEVRAREGSEKQSAWLFVHYELAFVHTSGVMSWPVRRSCALPISGPQAFGAAQSYTEKQFLRQIFKVPTGEKDADQVNQNEDAPQRPFGGRTAPETLAGATRAYNRPQAAPARSEAQTEHIRRQRLLARDIDNAATAEDVDNILASQFFIEWRTLGLTKMPDGKQSIPEHQAIEDRLIARGNARKAKLDMKEYEV